jgi:hypothetical protein
MMDLYLPYSRINPNAMKRLIRMLVMMVMLTELLTSCYTSKNLNKEKKPFTDEFLSKLEPGKRYEFKLKTGQKQTVYISSVEDQTISGAYYVENGKGKKIKSDYSTSFKSIQENVSEIHLRKFSPFLTIVTIVVPTTLAIIIGINAAQNMAIGY